MFLNNYWVFVKIWLGFLKYNTHMDFSTFVVGYTYKVSRIIQDKSFGNKFCCFKRTISCLIFYPVFRFDMWLINYYLDNTQINTVFSPL